MNKPSAFKSIRRRSKSDDRGGMNKLVQSALGSCSPDNKTNTTKIFEKKKPFEKPLRFQPREFKPTILFNNMKKEEEEEEEEEEEMVEIFNDNNNNKKKSSINNHHQSFQMIKYDHDRKERLVLLQLKETIQQEIIKCDKTNVTNRSSWWTMESNLARMEQNIKLAVHRLKKLNMRLQIVDQDIQCFEELMLYN